MISPKAGQTQTQKQTQSQPIIHQARHPAEDDSEFYESEYNDCRTDCDYDDYGDYNLIQGQRGGGTVGSGKAKTDKRHGKRGGGCNHVYSAKHVRAMEQQRSQRK